MSRLSLEHEPVNLVRITYNMRQMFGIAEQWEQEGTPWFKADILAAELQKIMPDEVTPRQFFDGFKNLVKAGVLEERFAGRPTCRGPWSDLPQLKEGQNKHLYYKAADENSPPVKIDTAR
ncbi:MAG: hypothetical protein KA035_00245 [Candidatus Levybacteria bacterium]|nr:hypothetical protein [Candidatus Levybacteria bacterium]